jgi:hypothetical protein
MKINIECAFKYLKHDYKRILNAVGVLIYLCIASIFAAAIYLYVPQIIGFVVSCIPNIGMPSAYILLNVVAAIIVLISTFGIAIFGNKEWFEYKPWKEGYGWGRSDHEPKGCGVCLAPIFGIGFVVYLFYWIEYILCSNWESPVISTIIFIVLILIGTPIGCAIARCKEE